MKMALTVIVTVIAVLSLILMPACSSREKVPDPIKVQEEIAEHRNQELELVRTTVLDEERVDRLIQLLSKRDKLIARNVKEIGAHREKMSELNADYNAERRSFDMLLTKFNNERAEAQKEFIELIGAMKMETTPEEWKAISKFQLKRLSPRNLTYGQSTGGG